MKVTQVTVQKEEKENSKLKGYASIVLDDCLKIENIRIIQGNNRMFAAMPNKKMPNGTYRDCVYPIGKESKLREEIDQAVIDEYNKL